MSSFLQGKRYAQAAFELAVEGEGVDTWQKDLQRMVETFEVPEFAEFLSAPHVPVSAKSQGVATLLPDVVPYVRNLANILIERRQTRIAPSVVKEFGEFADRERGILRGKVVTATPITKDQMLSIKKSLGRALNAKPDNLLLDGEVDPDVIGGISARIGSKLIDGSIRSRFQELKANLASSTVAFSKTNVLEESGDSTDADQKITKKQTPKTSKRKASK